MSTTISPWIQYTPDEKRYPALSHDIQTDVVVVGAGIFGIVTAYLLAQAGREVVLVERNHVAMGDTGFTTAFLTRDPDTLISNVAKHYGDQFAIEVLHATRGAQKLLYSIIQREHIDCDFQKCQSMYGSDKKEDAQLAAEWRLATVADPTAKFIGTDILAKHSPAMKSAIVLDEEGRFDVRKFLIGILMSETGKQITVFEETDVRNVQSNENGVSIETSHGTIQAKECVMATGRPHTTFTELATSLRMRTTYAIAAQYTTELPISDNIFWDTDDPYQYYRRLDDRTIILGGADQGTDEVAISSAAIAPHTTLKTWLSKNMPGDFEVTNAWSGNIYETEDGLPLIGPIPRRPHVSIATGFSGNGMVMGVMAADILTNQILHKHHTASRLFTLNRMNNRTQEGDSSIKQNAMWPTWVFGLVYAIVFLIPGWFFFSARDGFATLQQESLTEAAAVLFPLFGLYAFFFVWAQSMLGSLMPWWRKVIPWVEKFHRTEGVFALLFAVLHPLLIVMWVGIDGYLAKDFVSHSLSFYVLIGQTQLVLLMLTAGTALFMRVSWLRTRWHIIHFINYSLVPLIWVHSWFLGSDVQTSSLHYLWYFYGLTYLIAIALRFGWARKTRQYNGENNTSIQKPIVEKSSDDFVRVASADEVVEGKPHCVSIGTHDIALFKVGEKYFAIDNTCSHAGGPLCKGKIEGTTVTCPLHFSKFDVTTGAVLSPPARVAQTSYEVKVEGQDITIKIS